MSDFLLAQNIAPAYTMTFNNDKEVVIKMTWASGEFNVEGQIGYGAVLFFDFVKPHIDSYIKQQLLDANDKIKQLEDELYMSKIQNDIYKGVVDNK